MFWKKNKKKKDPLDFVTVAEPGDIVVMQSKTYLTREQQLAIHRSVKEYRESGLRFMVLDPGMSIEHILRGMPEPEKRKPRHLKDNVDDELDIPEHLIQPRKEGEW